MLLHAVCDMNTVLLRACLGLARVRPSYMGMRLCSFYRVFWLVSTICLRDVAFSSLSWRRTCHHPCACLDLVPGCLSKVSSCRVTRMRSHHCLLPRLCLRSPQTRSPHEGAAHGWQDPRLKERTAGLLNFSGFLHVLGLVAANIMCVLSHPRLSLV